jgi:hypothetical protein
VRRNGLIAINLQEVTSSTGSRRPPEPTDHHPTALGKRIRFSEEEVRDGRDTGRDRHSFCKGDAVAMGTVSERERELRITDADMESAPVSDYPLRIPRRRGVFTLKVTDRVGSAAAAW